MTERLREARVLSVIVSVTFWKLDVVPAAQQAEFIERLVAPDDFCISNVIGRFGLATDGTVPVLIVL